jgi:hypothetical protein
VELFEQIRREHEFGVGTISGVSRKLGVHRRLVREALSSAVPAASKPQERRLRKLEAAAPFIDRILSADQHARLCEAPAAAVGVDWPRVVRAAEL